VLGPGDGSHSAAAAAAADGGQSRLPRTLTRVAELAVAQALLVVVMLALPALASADISATEGALFSGQVGTDSSEVLCGSDAEIAWGDGATSTVPIGPEREIDGSHTYAEEGSYKASVTYERYAGDCSAYVEGFTATVADASLGSHGSTIAATAGIAFSGTVASFTDSDPAGAPADYATSIDWGDGHSSLAKLAAMEGGFALSGEHTYARSGKYTVTTSIIDAGGAGTSASASASVAPQAPTVLTNTVSEVGVSQATLNATVNPNEAEVSNCHFDWGTSSSYGAVVPCAPAPGAGAAPVSVTAGLTGLQPATTYHFRAVATNAGGTSYEAEQVFTTSEALHHVDPFQTQTRPVPISGHTANLTAKSGVVLIKAPGAAGFVRLGAPTSVTMGTIVDATHGHVMLCSAAATPAGQQCGEFWGGIFQIGERPGSVDLHLVLVGGKFAGCPASRPGAARASAARRPARHKAVRSLWGNGSGSFTIDGRNSSATVRDPIWLVQDTCRRTLTRVKQGSVSVHDYHRHRTFLVSAGHSYLAKAH
jgi:hypothetical protein